MFGCGVAIVPSLRHSTFTKLAQKFEHVGVIERSDGKLRLRRASGEEEDEDEAGSGNDTGNVTALKKVQKGKLSIKYHVTFAVGGTKIDKAEKSKLIEWIEKTKKKKQLEKICDFKFPSEVVYPVNLNKIQERLQHYYYRRTEAVRCQPALRRR